MLDELLAEASLGADVPRADTRLAPAASPAPEAVQPAFTPRAPLAPAAPVAPAASEADEPSRQSSSADLQGLVATKAPTSPDMPTLEASSPFAEAAAQHTEQVRPEGIALPVVMSLTELASCVSGCQLSKLQPAL